MTFIIKDFPIKPVNIGVIMVRKDSHITLLL
jgi:hypothetical protein